jgi:predicted O-methyltransferase YrrM
MLRSVIRGLGNLAFQSSVARHVLDSSPARYAMRRLRIAPWLQVPPGHFYSPIPDLAELRRDEQRVFAPVPRELPGVVLNESGQLALLDQFESLYLTQPFGPDKKVGLRYFFENEWYSYSDAIFLHCMIRHVRPKRIIEVGSGYSSGVILDTNEIFFDNGIHCTFVDPNPQNLRGILKDGDLARVDILEQCVQEIAPERFRELETNDVLFIDSSHVGKIGSDVNYIFAQILPSLHPGVYVHFHDIFYPFEYPKEWIYQGYAWNEAYLLRAFLTFNSAYEIVFYNTFLERFHRERFVRTMPLCLKDEGGSIWLRRR